MSDDVQKKVKFKGQSKIISGIGRKSVTGIQIRSARNIQYTQSKAYTEQGQEQEMAIYRLLIK